ncbi:helix-turn-helix domain-containing protein [Streptosporangium saharense]|uniref:helix-turn-helix domain-containing protein n=1 Tax=Streptosporangium saharense TaxID=1706840 RepID=UPI0036B2AF50
MAVQPLTDDELDQIRRMHADGHTLREVARTLGRASSSISRASARLGLTWDRAAQTATATAAASADHRERRLDIVARLYGQIETLLDRLESPVYNFTATTVNGIETALLDEAPAQEVKALIQALGTAATSAAKLEAIDSDRGAEGARSMLIGLVEGLRAFTAAIDEDETETDEADQDDAAEDEPEDA